MIVSENDNFYAPAPRQVALGHELDPSAFYRFGVANRDTKLLDGFEDGRAQVGAFS